MASLALSEIENKIKSVSYEEQLALFSFIGNLLKKNKNEKSEKFQRKLGGLENNFWISEDFDETPNCLKDYI